MLLVTRIFVKLSFNVTEEHVFWWSSSTKFFFNINYPDIVALRTNSNWKDNLVPEVVPLLQSHNHFVSGALACDAWSTCAIPGYYSSLHCFLSHHGRHCFVLWIKIINLMRNEQRCKRIYGVSYSVTLVKLYKYYSCHIYSLTFHFFLFSVNTL